MNFHDNSKKKNRTIFFSSFIRFRTFLNYLDQQIKTTPFEEGEGMGGVCMSLTRKNPGQSYVNTTALRLDILQMSKLIFNEAEYVVELAIYRLHGAIPKS